jgi:AAA domain
MKLPDKPKPKTTDFSKYKFLIYGDPGSGKSTFASRFPDAIFIPTEPGLNFLSVNQITDDDGNPKIIRNWTEFCEAIRLLCTSEHKFKTVVIDTVDNAFEFCALHVLQSRKLEHESDEGFGKGWGLIKREFTKVVNFLANSGFGIVFISHEKLSEREEKGVKRPFIDNSLSNQARVYVNGLVDFIFYCSMNDDGKRLMRTKASLNVNAKDRSGILPEVMPMDFDLLVKILNEKQKG